jgi:hypothetical protein
MTGIKESLEFVKGIELVGVVTKKVTADGKVNGEDIKHGLEIVTNAQVLIEAVKDIDLIDDEMKDLDEAELIQLGTATFMAIKAIKNAK